MGLPVGFDFRATSGFVTDPANCFPDLGVAYPTTIGGFTVGWLNTGGTIQTRDRTTGVDPRLAGAVFNTSNTDQWQCDLPSAGPYNIYLAMGDASNSGTVTGQLLKDNTTTLGTYTGSFASGEFFDATGVIRTSAAWPGSNVPLACTFATTTLLMVMATAGANTINHIFIEPIDTSLRGSLKTLGQGRPPRAFRPGIAR